LPTPDPAVEDGDAVAAVTAGEEAVPELVTGGETA